MDKLRTRLAILTTAAACVGASWGCGLFGSDNNVHDIMLADDLGGVEDSVAFLDDVTILRDNGAPLEDAVAGDTGVAQDTMVVGADASDDSSVSDVTEPGDAAYGDPGTTDGAEIASDVPGDTGTDVTGLRMPCTDAATDCPPGFTCESTTKDGLYCRPPQECSLDGLTDMQDLLGALAVDAGGSPFFVKVAVEVKMGPKTCSMEQCGAGECCRDCFASMTVAGSDLPIVIRGPSNPICSGSDSSDGTWCKELDCTPLIPAEKYVIWGSIRMFSPVELVMDGFCLLSDAQPAVD